MRILCVIDSLGAGGAQRQLVELAKGFKEKGHEVEFLIYHDIIFFGSQLKEQNIPITIITESNYFKRLLKIRNAIRSYNPHVVISYLEAANFMATIAGFPARKWKLVVGERSANPAILSNKKLRSYRFFHLFADLVIANSYTNLELVKKANPFLKKNRLKVIYNFVNIPNIFLPKINTSKITNIVVAASYRPVKNLEGLIDAVILLPREYRENLRIDWYGDITIDSDFFHMAKVKLQEESLQETIHLHNKTKDIVDKYVQADFIGLFSHYEGFPNTICEAMAIGKPVIVTEVSDVPLFIKEGVNGYLCHSKNANSIAQSLIKAIDSNEDIKSNMGNANRIVADEFFNREKIVAQYLKLLNE